MNQSLLLQDPQYTIDKIVDFLKQTFEKNGKKNAVIAVSGGIDSALSLALLAQALPPSQIYPVFLPYKDQSIEDSQAICDFLSLPKENIHTINITPVVDAAVDAAFINPQTDKTAQLRQGNMMARARMIMTFDLAKEKDALVCGTENKSEHYLGYFTRFGDAASDIEPICRLYKTQVRQLAEVLHFPSQFLTKAPSAGLWQGQTDEQEMGFSYAVADQVLFQYVDQKKQASEIQLEGVSDAQVQAVVHAVQSNAFKHQVPYMPSME